MMINKFYSTIIFSATILNFLFGLKNDLSTFEIISSTQNRLHVQFDFNELDFFEINLNSQTYLIPKIQNTVYNQKKGFPNLPSLSESIIIPKGKKAIISYKINQYDEFANINIAPSKGKITRDKNPDDIKYTFNNIYNSDVNFPEHPVKLDSSFVLRGILGTTIQLIPFSYNLQAKRLIFYKNLDIFIDFVDDVYSNTPIEANLTSPYRNIIENQFINFENDRTEMIPDHGSMIIITDESYLMDLEPFIDWKNMKGIPTEVFTTQFIGNSTDLIKSFIFNQYIDNQISYVLLVGDTDNVATFWPDGQTPSDLMYGYLDGDDAYPEILIGRFSAESNEDIQVQVERVLRYEKYMNTEAIWYNKGIGIASNEGEGIGDDGESDFIHMDNIRERLINYNYTSIDQAYDIYNISPTQVYDFINSGRGIINYTGHGSTNSWISSGFSIQDINQLNNVDKYPFILSVSCNTGASQYGESMAEAWLNASQNLIPTGAISVAASSSLMQWAPPMECQDEFNDILTKTYADKQIYSFGGFFTTVL